MLLRLNKCTEEYHIYVCVPIRERDFTENRNSLRKGAKFILEQKNATGMVQILYRGQT